MGRTSVRCGARSFTVKKSAEPNPGSYHDYEGRIKAPYSMLLEGANPSGNGVSAALQECPPVELLGKVDSDCQDTLERIRICFLRPPVLSAARVKALMWFGLLLVGAALAVTARLYLIRRASPKGGGEASKDDLKMPRELGFKPPINAPQEP